MSRRFLAATCLFALMLAHSPVAWPAVVPVLANGDFENDLPPWQPMDIGCWGNSVHYRIGSDPAQVGYDYVELGTNNSPGGIYQTFATSPNVTYGVSFWGSGSETQPLHTGYVAVGSGTFDGTVTDANQNVQWSLIPSSLLAPTAFSVNRNGANSYFGWNTYGGYQFTATSAASTITFWNDAASSARVDNVAIMPISGPAANAVASGDWNSVTTWSTSAVPGPNSITVAGRSLTINPTVSTLPASCVSLSISGSGSLRVYGGQSLSVSGSVDVPSGNTLRIDSGGSLLLNSASTSRMAGLLPVSGSTLGVTTQLTVDSNVDLTGVKLAMGANTPVTLASGTLTKTDGLNVGTLQVTGGSLNLGSSSLTVANLMEVDNSSFSVKNAVAPQILVLVNASLSGAGSVRPTGYYSFSNIPAGNPTSTTVWGGAGVQMSIGDDGRGGTVVLSASNTYDGTTSIENGALQAADGWGLPKASNLVLNGGVLETSGTFSRRLGPGAGQVDWYAGGFSAHGGKLLVTLGNAPAGSYTTMIWASYGSPSFVRENMVLGSQTADSEVEIPHSIDLNGASHDINVVDNPASSGDFATLSGALVNGIINKSGKGKLALTNSGNSLSAVYLNDGTISMGNSGALGSSGSITFGGGSLQFASSNGADLSNRIKNSTAAIALEISSGTENFYGNIDATNLGGLDKRGLGTLVLSGTDTYLGGTTVEQGVLVIANRMAIPDGGSLTIGSGAIAIFGSSLPAAPPVAASSVAPFPVPEPSTFGLLATGIVILAGVHRRWLLVRRSQGSLC